MLLRFRRYLQERDLSYLRMTPKEWEKDNSQTGEARLDILRKIMKSNTPVPTNAGKEIKIPNSKENLSALDLLIKNKKPVKFSTSAGEISSSQIGKSPVFGGGGGGSGGGSTQTQYAESLQCVYIQAMLNGRIKSFEDYKTSDLEAAIAKTDVGGTKNEDMLGLDASWHWSAYWTAKGLINKGIVNKSHIIHRGSDAMKEIYAIKKEAFKNSKMRVLSDDKWNPGDIWAIKRGVNLRRLLPNTSVQELNSALVKAFHDKTIVGISLKKILNDSGLKLKVYNEEESTDIHKFKSTSLMAKFAKKASDFWRSKKGDILFDAGKMDIRTSSALASVNVEIQLKTARGGRAGWGEIQQTFLKRLNKRVPDNKALIRMAKDLHSRGGKSRYANVFYNMASKVHNGLDKKQFMDGLQSRPMADIHSKLGAIYVSSALVANQKNGKSNLIITDLVNYAGSKGAESSIYVKAWQ